MNWLAIDTSTEIASVALWFNDELTSLTQGNQRTHAQFLLPMIDQVLSESDAQLNQMDAIVFGRGPGSFTGLRIACSTAKGLAVSADLPVIPVSTLGAIAYSARTISGNHEADILAVLDARMQEVYWGFYESDQLDTLELVSPADQIDIKNNGHLILAGVGIDLLPRTIHDEVQSSLTLYPDASAMIQLAREMRLEPISAALAEPVYVRNKVTHGG